VESANEAVRAVAAQIEQSGGFELVEVAFLDCSPPDLSTAVARLVQRGAKSVVVVPYFLTLGTHLQRDLPKLVQAAAQEHGGIEISVTLPLDGHPALAQILLERTREALHKEKAT
jgi:sirohydrochlorin ferrochelatase